MSDGNLRDRKTNTLTAIILIGIITILAITILVVAANKTDLFTTDGSYTKRLAQENSIVAYQKSCEYPGYIDVINNPNNYKDKDLKYYGLVKDVKTDTFGDTELTLRITIPEEELSKIDKDKYSHSKNEKHYYAIVKIEMEANEVIEAYSGDTVAVYGLFDKIDEDGIIYLKGRDIVRKDTK